MCTIKAVYVTNVHNNHLPLFLLTTSSCPAEVNWYTMELTSRFPGLPPLAATSRSRPPAMEIKVKARAPTVERVWREGETEGWRGVILIILRYHSYSHAKQWRQTDTQTDRRTDRHQTLTCTGVNAPLHTNSSDPPLGELLASTRYCWPLLRENCSHFSAETVSTSWVAANTMMVPGYMERKWGIN